MTFYRWLLGQETSLTLADLVHVSPNIHRTLRKMQEIIRQRDAIVSNDSLTQEEKEERVLRIDAVTQNLIPSFLIIFRSNAWSSMVAQ